MKDKFINYILEHFTIDRDGKLLLVNIVEWIWTQAMDKEDTINALLCLLDGIGIEKAEIEKFIDW